ncbi:MAG: type VI secretion system accessory protein TagJ [Acidobacteriota bacterium]|jgi:type VI secretion system protein ImpE
MRAHESLREGKLQESLEQLQDQIRKDPSNSKYRVFLFQLLAVLGDWERAMTQLKVLGEMDAGTLPMVQTYREALRCEALRTAVFAGERSPLVLGEPEEWLALLMQSLHAVSSGKTAEAEDLRGRALDAAPTTAGAIDERAFEWIADADSRLGPVLEAIVNGRYYWVPFHRIRRIEIEEPGDLRDVVWMPAQFRWANGGETVGLIPTRYPGSERAKRSEIRLARVTEWLDQGENGFFGLGQRMLATDAGEYPLMDIRAIDLQTGEPVDEPAGEASGGEA